MPKRAAGSSAATSSTASSSSSRPAADLKEDGNAAFKAFKLERAVEFYSAAIAAAPGDAVYVANRSAALFEAGRYAEALADIKLALSQHLPPALASKLALRAARCAIWQLAPAQARTWLQHRALQAPPEEVPQALAEQVAATEQLCAAMKEAQDAALTETKQLKELAQGCGPGAPGLLRGRARTLPPMMFVNGQDSPHSLFAGSPEAPQPHEVTRQGAICEEGRPPLTTRNELANPYELHLFPHLHALDAETRSYCRKECAVMLGGCGDARHLFATLIDAATLREQPAGMQRSKVLQGIKLDIVLNDARPEVAARAYVLLTLLDTAASQIPASAPQLPASKALPDAAVAALAAFWHVYQSPTLAEPIHAALQSALRKIAAASKAPLPWLRCTGGSWAAVQRVCAGWVAHGMTLEEDKQIAAECDACEQDMHSSHRSGAMNLPAEGVRPKA